MTNNKLIKLLCSIPVVLVVLFFIPFLGVCLLLFRFYVYRNEKKYKTSIILIVLGILLLIPKLLNSILKLLKLTNIKIPYLNTILSSNIYGNLLSYSKLLIIVGVVFIILSYIFSNLFNNFKSKLDTGLQNYIEKEEQKDYEIRQKNDLIMQEKREIAKNTHIVKCPNCGASNTLTSTTGTCNHCRTLIAYKEK